MLKMKEKKGATGSHNVGVVTRSEWASGSATIKASGASSPVGDELLSTHAAATDDITMCL